MRKEVELTNQTQSQTHTFVLRIWRETAVADWRFTLQAIQPEAKRHFSNPQALLNHLETVLTPDNPPYLEAE